MNEMPYATDEQGAHCNDDEYVSHEFPEACQAILKESLTQS
jgi:hypothetical protein